ncbi:MAG: ExbD/TolR family protein [Chlamydiia bacterium]
MIKRRPPPDEPPMHLTPLIDVVFVVLIAFIVIAPMLETEHIDLASSHPHLTKPKAEVQELLQIRVLADDSIWYRGERVTSSQLEQLLRAAKRQHPKGCPVLLQDRKATFGTYQAVKQSCEIAGYSSLDVVLQPGRR